VTGLAKLLVLPEAGLRVAAGETVNVGARFVTGWLAGTWMLMFVPEIVAAPSAPKLQLRMALAELFVKATVAVGVSTTFPSVTSVAVKTDEPLVIEVTAKVTSPLAVEAPEAPEMVSLAGRLEASVTVLPGMGLL
jgi:hypothetical protein